MSEGSQDPAIDQAELDALLSSLAEGEGFADTPQSAVGKPKAESEKSSSRKDSQPESASMGIDQEELDKLLASLGDEEIFADSPEQIIAAKQAALESNASTDIDQAELDALLAAMGDEELFSDEPPQIKASNANPSPPKQERTLSQEEIDALLASLGN